MFNKLLNDSGVKFLLNNKKYVKLLKLIFIYIIDRFKKYRKVSVNNIDKVDVSFGNLANITKLNIKNSEEKSYKIQLIGIEIELTDDIFEYNFVDQESLFSVYRFRWLLIGIESYKDYGFINKSMQVINKWIDTFDNNERRVNETYSICERLLNILYFISIVKNYNEKLLNNLYIKKLEKIYGIQIVDILNNIEDNGKYTNNHILNNARALYILGSILNNKDIIEVSKDLLYLHIDTHIIDGVLLEGSFHYQVLLTRTVLEIYHTAQMVNDKNMIEFIEQYANNMITITQSIHSDFSDCYPVIGDISPDFPIEFFQGYPFSNSCTNSCWNNIFNIKLTNTDKEINSRYKYWDKYIFGNIEIWIVNKNNGVLPHGHNDNGSFHIFFHGKPITIDIGRFTYNRNTMYDFMLEETMHNGINENLDLSRSSILFNHFKKVSTVNIEKIDNKINVSIIDCFKSLKFSYTLIVKDNTIIIDSVLNISLFLNTIKSINYDIIQVEDIKIILRNKCITIDNTLYAKNYGELTLLKKVEGINKND